MGKRKDLQAALAPWQLSVLQKKEPELWRTRVTGRVTDLPV